MTQSVTAITACDAGLWLDNASGVLKEVGGSSNKVAMKFDREIGMFRTFKSQWPRRLECGKDAEFTLNIIYTTAADEGFDILKNWYFAANPGDRTFKVYLPDKNVGSDVYAGEFKLKSFNFTPEAGSANPIEVSAVLVPNGAVTLAVNAT